MKNSSTKSQDKLNDALIQACEKGDVTTLRHLLTSPRLKRHADIHFHDDYPLAVACQWGHLAVVRYLLTSDELTQHATLHSGGGYLMACCKGHLDVVKYLLTSPELSEHADIHTDSNRGLRWACKRGHLEVVSYLLYDMKMSVCDATYTLMPDEHSRQELVHQVAQRDLFFKINSALTQENCLPNPQPKI